MSNAVNQIAATDIAAAASRNTRPQKEQGSDDGSFLKMLSDAVSSQPNETAKPSAEKPVQQANESTSTATGTEQPATQTKPAEQPSATDIEQDTAYEQQAVAAAMQMQVILPVIAGTPQTEMPQTEVSEEITAAAEPIEIQPMQTVQTNTEVLAETIATGESQPKAAQEIPNREAVATEQVKAEQVTAERPQTAEAAVKTETQARPAEHTARTAETAPDTRTNRQEPQFRAHMQAQAQTAQRQTIQQEQGTKPIETQTTEGGEAEAQILRQPETPRPMHQMRNMREPEAAQAKFDGMLARASRELNQTTVAQEAQPVEELPEEIQAAKQPVTVETKPQETVKQTAPETEIKQSAEAKPAEQATVQKSVKAPVTEQRPQQEVSKPDETLLGMTQQKPPEIRHEVIRSEPVQQPQQAQAPDQAEQIKAQVIKHLDKERTEFQMQLQPEELGKVNVKMILESGKLSVEIAAVNPKSAEMLTRQAESLIASLKASGADVTSVNVVTANENTSADMSGEFNLNNFQSRENRQGHSGHASRTGTAGEQAGTSAQAERETPKAPQRILNYSV